MKSLPSNNRQSDAVNDGLNDTFADPPPLESLGDNLPATKSQDSILESQDPAELPAEPELNGNGNSSPDAEEKGTKSILQSNDDQPNESPSTSNTDQTESQPSILENRPDKSQSVFEQSKPSQSELVRSNGRQSDPLTLEPAVEESVGELPEQTEGQIEEPFGSGVTDGQSLMTAQGWVLDSGRDESFEAGPQVADVTNPVENTTLVVEESGANGQVVGGPEIAPPTNTNPLTDPSSDLEMPLGSSTDSETELGQNSPMPAETDVADSDPFEDAEPSVSIDDQTQTETNNSAGDSIDASEMDAVNQNEGSSNQDEGSPSEDVEDPFDDPDDPFSDSDPVQPEVSDASQAPTNSDESNRLPADESANQDVANQDVANQDIEQTEDTTDEEQAEGLPDEGDDAMDAEPSAENRSAENPSDPFAEEPENGTLNSDSEVVQSNGGSSVDEAPSDVDSVEQTPSDSTPTDSALDPTDPTEPVEDLPDGVPSDNTTMTDVNPGVEDQVGLADTDTEAGLESASTLQTPVAKPANVQEGGLLDYWWAALPLLLLPLLWFFIRKKSRISEVELVQAAGGRGWKKAELSKPDSSLDAGDESFELTAAEGDEPVESNGSDDSIVGIVNRFRDGDIADSSEMYSDDLSDISGLVDLSEPEAEVAVAERTESFAMESQLESEASLSLDDEAGDSFFDSMDLDDEEQESNELTVAELALMDSASSSDMDVLSPRVQLSIDQESNHTGTFTASAVSDSSEFDFSADSEFNRVEAGDHGVATSDELVASEETRADANNVGADENPDDSSENILMFDEPEEDGFLAEVDSVEPKTTESSEAPANDLSAELEIELKEIDGVRAPGFPEEFSVPVEAGNDLDDSDMFDMHEDIDILNLDDVSSEDLLADQEIASDGAVLAEAFGDADSDNGIPESIFSLTAKPDASEIDLPAFEQPGSVVGNGQQKNSANESGVFAIGNESPGDASESMKASRSSKKRDLLLEIEKLRGENDRLNSTLRAATDEKMVLAEQLQNSENKILELSGTLDATNQEKAQFGDRLRANESKFTDLSLALTAAKSSEDDLTGEIDELRQKLAEADARIDTESNIEKTLQRVQAEFEHALAEKETLVQKLNEVESELNQASEWEVRVKELEQSFTQAIEENEGLNAKLTQLEGKHSDEPAIESNEKPTTRKKKRTTKIDPETGVVKISRKDEGALKMLEALKKENRKRKQSDLLLAQAEEQRAELVAELRVLREREVELLNAAEDQQGSRPVDDEQPSEDFVAAQRKVVDLEIAMEELVADKQEQAKLIDRLKAELDGLKSQVAATADKADARPG